MDERFRIEISFAEEDSDDASIIVIGGKVLSGDLANGIVGHIDVDGKKVHALQVKDVAFLEGAEPDCVMFSVFKPEISYELERWVGKDFVG